MIDLRHGDCFDVLRTLGADSVDSVVTDPPYHLTSGNAAVDWAAMGSNGTKRPNVGPTNRDGSGHKTGFMGKQWDGGDIAFRPELWAEVLRVLKPGGHLLAFSGTRTYHRMACAIEDAGFEVRDQIGWLYGSGFPKSLNVSKALDKAAGAEREVVGNSPFASRKPNGSAVVHSVGLSSTPGAVITAPATDAARQWDGWGTALKPAWEPICVARKPLAEPTVAAQVLKTGTGAINVDGCRVAASDGYTENAVTQGVNTARTSYAPAVARRTFEPASAGRWPANIAHDGSDEVLQAFAAFGERPGFSGGGRREGLSTKRGSMAGPLGNGGEVRYQADTGTAARFFYCAKSSRAERGEGNTHPTVKPLSLMSWLVRLVTPPGGTVLDPFGGSGTTGLAAQAEGFRAVLIEREAAYIEIIKKRIAASQPAQAASIAEQLDLVSLLDPAA